MKDLTVSLEDRPGTLADLGEALGKAGINIEGLTAVSGRTSDRPCPRRGRGRGTALEGAGIKVEGEAEPLISEVPSGQVDQPGVVGQMARPWPMPA